MRAKILLIVVMCMVIPAGYYLLRGAGLDQGGPIANEPSGNKANTFFSPASYLSVEASTVWNKIVQSFVGRSVWMTVMGGIGFQRDLIFAITALIGRSELRP